MKTIFQLVRRLLSVGVIGTGLAGLAVSPAMADEPPTSVFDVTTAVGGDVADEPLAVGVLGLPRYRPLDPADQQAA